MPRADKYRNIGRAPIAAPMPAVSTRQIEVIDRWGQYVVTAGGFNSLPSTGKVFSAPLAPQLPRRSIYFGFLPWFDNGTAATDNRWMFRGRLELLRERQVIAVLPWSEITYTQTLAMPQTPENFHQRATASNQPTLTYNRGAAGGTSWINGAEFPAFEFTAAADQADFYFEESVVEITTGQVAWLAGFRVMSN